MGKIFSTRLAIAMSLLLFSLTLVLMVTPAYASPGTITVQGKLEYVNEWGGFSPMRRVKVYLMDNDIWEGASADEQVAWQYTDDAGNFAFTVNNDDGLWQDGRDPYVRVESSNPAAVAMSPFSVIYNWQLPQAGTNVPDGFSHNYLTVHPDFNNDAWQAIDAVLSVRDWIWSRVSWERPTKVNIYWPAISLWPYSDGNAIYLPDKAYWDWDHVEVYHQYALCVVYTLYGNKFPDGWLGPVPPHRAFYESSVIFAFVEGWAEFIQCAVDNNPNNLVDWNGGHGGNIETNDWFNCNDMGDMDGEIIEGSVASVLWDIFDPANEPHDTLSLGFDEIFYIIRDYKTPNFGSFWDRWVVRYPAHQGDLSTICWVYGIDKDFYPPTGSIIINGGDTYTTSTSVTLTLSASDYGSGVAYMRFSNFPWAWFWGIWFPQVWSEWIPYSTTASWTLWTGDGVKTVYAQFKDNKGLVTAGPWLPEDSIILDTVAPVGSIIINGDATYTTSTSVTLTLAYSDATSGVWRVRYSNDGIIWTPWEGPSTTRAWTLTPGDGTKTVYYQVQDHAGLVSLIYVDTIILDTTPPMGSVVINGGALYTQSPSVTLTLTYSDATSGVKQVRYSNDMIMWTLWEFSFPFRFWTLTPGDGTKTVYYQIQDNAGNIYTTLDDILLDSTPPTTTAGHANPSSTVTLSRSDPWPGSGISATYYRIDWGEWKLYGGPFTVNPPAPHTHVIEYYSKDLAGNVENPKTLTLHYLTIDTNIPAVTPVYHPPQEGWYTQGYEAMTPAAPDKYPWPPPATGWYGFQTWEKDTVAVPGNPVEVIMGGPHWLRAGYLGVEVTGSVSGHTLSLTLGIRSEITYTYQLYLRIVGPSYDVTMEFGTVPMTGGIDITMPLSVDVSGLSVGSYDVYIMLFDPVTGDERARDKLSFNIT